MPGGGGYEEFVKSMQTMMESAQAQFGAMTGIFLPWQNALSTKSA
jgi:hypothetical protein